MGVFVSRLMRTASPPNLSTPDINLLEELGFWGDDGSGWNDRLKRDNAIGTNSYPTITNLADWMPHEKATLVKSSQKLRDNGWIQEVGVIPYSGAKIYRLNIFRAFCYLDLHVIKSTEELKKKDPELQKLMSVIDSAFDGDIPEYPVKNLNHVPQGHYIQNWRELLANGEIIDYWLHCRGADGRVIDDDSSPGTEEASAGQGAGWKDSKGCITLSHSNDSIDEHRFVNDAPVNLPHKVTFKKANGEKETLVFTAEHINGSGELDVSLLGVSDEIKQEFDRSSNAEKFKLQTFNSNHKDRLLEIRENHLRQNKKKKG